MNSINKRSTRVVANLKKRTSKVGLWHFTFLSTWARFNVFFALFNGGLIVVVIIATYKKNDKTFFGSRKLRDDSLHKKVLALPRQVLKDRKND